MGKCSPSAAVEEALEVISSEFPAKQWECIPWLEEGSREAGRDVSKQVKDSFRAVQVEKEDRKGSRGCHQILFPHLLEGPS